jgi:GNAT superfamily N-acetyltransferase
MVDVRLATSADLDSISIALARAFADDPIFSYLFEGMSNVERRAARFFRELAPIQLAHNTLYVPEGDVVGASLWDPPGQWRMPVSTQLKMAPSLLFKVFGARSFSHLRDYARVEKVHAQQTEPHYYLAVLGTEPDQQGKGIGSALMQPILDQCDTEGVGAYLESSKEKNIPFYARHGFKVLSEHQFHAGGPSLWPMWRDPRPPV